MDKEYLTNNIRAHSISRPTPNTHEDPRSHQTVEASRKTGPHTRENQEQQATQHNRAATKGVRQRHPPQVRRAQHENVARDEVRQLRERLWWEAKHARGRVDGQCTRDGGTGEVYHEWMYRHDSQDCELAPHGQIERIRWVGGWLRHETDLIVICLRRCPFEMF